MRPLLELAITTEQLADGEPEERATAGRFTLTAETRQLAEGLDHYTRDHRDGPMVPGYYIGQWLAWNWWRLRCEPRTRASDWFYAHEMAAIGDGYCWPNITIWSDGLRTALVARPSASDAKPFRYLADQAVVVPAATFEGAVDHFVQVILERLDGAEELRETNLHKLWEELQHERRDPERGRYRRLEAMLGFDPGEAEDRMIGNLLSAEKQLGITAVDEIAADWEGRNDQATNDPTGAEALRQAAADSGTEVREADGIRLPPGRRIESDDPPPPYEIGQEVARAVRNEAQLGAGPISNVRLAELAGTSPGTLDRGENRDLFPFVLRYGDDSRGRMGRVVMRSAWQAGRRFDMARLICDRLVFGDAESLAPATNTRTYRQKVQRAFAAEVLVPIGTLKEFHAGDYSEDRQIKAAEYFTVSQLMIKSHLKNNHLIPREDEADFPDHAAV